jgi:hypothetical protein
MSCVDRNGVVIEVGSRFYRPAGGSPGHEYPAASGVVTSAPKSPNSSGHYLVNVEYNRHDRGRYGGEWAHHISVTNRPGGSPVRFSISVD